MAKNSTVYVCNNCGFDSPKWVGRCPSCKKWNTFQEMALSSSKGSGKSRKAETVKANSIKPENIKRMQTGITELDRVLGGGIVPGQVVLFGGEPGIGKSTLLTQLALKVPNRNTLYYVCGEESPHQVSLRIKRLSSEKIKDNLVLVPETDVDAIIGLFEKTKPSPSLIIVDSIQTLTTQDLTGAAGSIGQVRESAQRLITWAKRSQVPILIVGHITKSGSIAGPKVLEHAVDTVVYFEGERLQDLRMLKTIKNRFGATDEVGIFKMSSKGLSPAGKEMLEKILGSPKPGSALSVISEGSRIMLIEIQALVTQSFTAYPKRVITGLSKNRAEMIIAVAQKQLKVPLYKYDIYLNVAGGLRIEEPAADLAAVAAIYSSYKNKNLPKNSCFIGEVSLLGEVSGVSRSESRQKQAREIGTDKVYADNNIRHISSLKKLF